MSEQTPMPPGAAVTRSAYAKLNLALSVGPPREDGMHPIASWMTPISLVDDLLVTRLEDDRFSRYAILWHEDAPVKSEIDWSITRDLAVRAHLLLEQEVGRTLPVQLKLDKRIPVGGGLGGGSADAAAMMLAVRDLFAIDLSDGDLVRLGAGLGSDVPFCLEPRAGVVEGLGDRIERTDTPRGAVVLVLPEFGCPTGDVYRAFDSGADGALRAEDVRAMAKSGVIAPDALFNDLTAPAARVRPEIEEIRDEVASIAESPAHMTGSGSTLFVYCEAGEEHAALLRDALRAELEDCEIIATTLGA